ncbi:hypothetical protein OAU50_07445 [Planctomycetota bacterium]|nr:hypothetical protein [Planctomycetota bacterium]
MAPQTKNAREITVAVIKTADEPFESIPTAPYGAIVIVAKNKLQKKLDKKVWPKLATRLAESGCEWATLHANKNTDALHKIFDDAIVQWQLKDGTDVEFNTSGDVEDNLEEAMRDAVYYGHSSYGEPFPHLLVVVVGEELDGLDARAESLAGSVEK